MMVRTLFAIPFAKNAPPFEIPWILLWRALTPKERERNEAAHKISAAVWKFISAGHLEIPLNLEGTCADTKFVLSLAKA